MKAFSPAGMAVKGFFGYGAKTFANPSGHTSGNGAAGDASSGGGSTSDGVHGDILPPPATPAGPPVPPTTLTVNLAQDYIADFTGAPGVTLTQLLTDAGELAAWQSGTYGTLVIQSDGLAPRGYYIIAGDDGGFTQSGPGFAGLVIDTGPAGFTPTVKILIAGIAIYGGGGSGGNESGGGDGGAGGDAIDINFATNLTLDLTGAGYPVGCCFAGGGGGRWGNPVGGGDGGGGGAGGWNAGHGLDAGNTGQVYDPNNAGTAPTFPNGGGGGTSGDGGGTGGGLGQPGKFGDNGQPLIYPNGPAGLAVKRSAAGSTTTIGATVTNLAGVVQ